MSLAALMDRPTRALNWADRRAAAISAACAGLFAFAVFTLSLLPAVGLAGAAVAAGVVLIVGGTWLGVRRAPQLTGTLWTAASTGFLFPPLMLAFGPGVGLDVPLMPLLVYPFLAAAVAAVVWALPSKGVHRGWSTVVASIPLLIAHPLSAPLTGTVWEGVVTTAAGFAAAVVAVARSRKAKRGTKPSLLRKMGRAVLMLMAGAILGMSVPMMNAPEANAFPFSGAISSATCDMLQPDFSPSPVGTGPEQLFANINFGGARAADGSVPQYADEAVNFTGSGENFALDNYTLYEVAGLRGNQWFAWARDSEFDTASCSVPGFLSATFGGLVMKVNGFVLQGVIALKEYSQVENPLEGMYEMASGIVGTIVTDLAAPLMSAILMISGLMIVVRSIQAGGVRAAVSDLGMSLAMILIFGFFYSGVAVASWANPGTNGFYVLGNALDSFAGQANSEFSKVVLSPIGNKDRPGTTMCKIPESGANSDSAAGQGQRITSCILAETLMYKPWAIGQFGTAGEDVISTEAVPKTYSDPSLDAEPEMSAPENEGDIPCYNNVDGCNDMRTYLIAQSGGPSILARQEACMGTDGDPGIELVKKCVPQYALAQLLINASDDNPGEEGISKNAAADIWSSYKGAGGSYPHVSQAASSFLAIVISGFGLAIMALITLSWHAILFWAFLSGPFQLTYAVMLGKHDVGKKWLLGVFGTYVQRFLYGALMTVFIWMIASIFGTDQTLGVKLLWILLLLVASLYGMKKVQGAAPDGAPNMARAGQTVGFGAAAATGYAAKKGVVDPAMRYGVKPTAGRAGRAMARSAGKDLSRVREGAGKAGSAVGSAARTTASNVASGTATAGRVGAVETARGASAVGGRVRARAEDPENVHRVSRAVVGTVDSAGAAATKARRATGRVVYRAGEAVEGGRSYVGDSGVVRGARHVRAYGAEAGSRSAREQFRGEHVTPARQRSASENAAARARREAAQSRKQARQDTINKKNENKKGGGPSAGPGKPVNRK